MEKWQTILYAVLGAIGAIAVLVIVIAGCLICKEKRDKKRKRKDRYEILKTEKKERRGNKPQPRATHPDARSLSRTERVQPASENEAGRISVKHPEIPPRSVSECGRGRGRGNSHHKASSTSGYQHLTDENTSQDDSETDRKSTHSLGAARRSNASQSSNPLLNIPFKPVVSGRQSSCSGTSVSEDESRRKSQLDLSEVPSPFLGKLYICLYYDFQDSSLVLKVLRAAELAAKDLGGTSDPYVRIMLLPDKKHKLETKVKHKCLSPVWNETFLFERFPYEKLKTRTIHLEVLDKDRFTSDDPIGEVFLPLVDMNLAERTSADETELVLQPVDEERYRLGEILVALGYDPNREKLSLTVIKCRDLKAKDITTGSSDPYVKVWLQRKGKRLVKHKTAILRRELNPVFNESFVFDVPLTEMRQTSLRVTVRDHDVVGVNETIGSVTLGPQSGLTESRQWTEMMAKGKTPVSAWHALRKDAAGKDG